MKIFLFIILCYFSTMHIKLFANDLANGQTLFKARCAACHGITTALTGPALVGISDRHSEAWILSFVRNSQKMVMEGDEAAIQIFKNYNSLPMPIQKDLSDEDIRNILFYLNTETRHLNVCDKEQKYLASTTSLQKNFLELDTPSTFFKVGLTSFFIPIVLFGYFFYRNKQHT